MNELSNKITFFADKKINSNWIWFATLVLVWLFQYGFSSVIDPYIFSIILYSGINIILAVSLNLVNGYTGQFSMGHAGFMSIGAYTSAFLSTTVQTQHPALLTSGALPFFFVGFLIVGGLMACFCGYLVGLPSLRLKGDYLAIVTLGFGEIIRVIFLNTEAVGGARGLPGIPNLSNFGWIYTFVVITTFFVVRIMKTHHGRSFLSVREDEIAAEAMGINTTKAKVKAFVLGAFFAGIAGGLFAHQLRFIDPVTFDFNKSFEIIIMVVLGGMGSTTGSIIAAIFLTSIREALRPLQELTKVDFRMVIYALLLIVLMLNRPNGLFGTKEFSEFFPFLARKKKATV